MTIGDLTYRIHRQRRLLCLLGVLPFAGAAIGGLDPLSFTIALVLACLVIAAQVIWPASWIETTGMSAATGLMLADTPLTSWLTALPNPDLGATTIMWVVVFNSLGWAALACFLAMGLIWLNSVPAGQRTFRATSPVPLEPRRAAEAFVTLPGKAMHNRTCGPETDDGTYQITFPFECFDETTFQPVIVDGTYQARLMEEELADDRVRYVQQYITEKGTSVLEQTFVRDGDGSTYTYCEVLDHFSVLNAMFFWLQDFHADHMRAEIDGYLGRPTPAMAFKSQRGMFARFAGWLQRLGSGPDDEYRFRG